MDLDYYSITARMEEERMERERIEQIVKKYSPIDKDLYKEDRSYSKEDIDLLLDRTWSIPKNKKNAKTINAFERVFKHYEKTGNEKMLDSMTEIFNKYFKPYSAEDRVEKGLFHKLEYKVLSAENERFCFIDTSKLPKKLDKQIQMKDEEIQSKEEEQSIQESKQEEKSEVVENDETEAKYSTKKSLSLTQQQSQDNGMDL